MRNAFLRAYVHARGNTGARVRALPHVAVDDAFGVQVGQAPEHVRGKPHRRLQLVIATALHSYGSVRIAREIHLENMNYDSA